MARRFSYWVFRATRALVKFFYPVPTLVGESNIPAGACVIVGNHAQMNGPIVAELYVPGDRFIWCNAEMMHLKEVPAYSYKDFWSEKPKSVRWFYKILSYMIAPLSVCIFNNAHCIGVYRDLRIRKTFSQTISRLKEDARIVIFPEIDPPVNNILYSFQERFIDLGKMYGRQTGKNLSFVPMYVASGLKMLVFGKPIVYDTASDSKEERERICKELIDSISELAYDLPPHRVVPYRNMSKRLYPTNERPNQIHK